MGVVEDMIVSRQVIFATLLISVTCSEAFNFRLRRNTRERENAGQVYELPAKVAAKEWNQFVRKDTDQIMKTLMDFMQNIIRKYEKIDEVNRILMKNMTPLNQFPLFEQVENPSRLPKN